MNCKSLCIEPLCSCNTSIKLILKTFLIIYLLINQTYWTIFYYYSSITHKNVTTYFFMLILFLK